MNSTLTLKYAIVTFYILQRVFELFLSKKNEEYLKKNYKIINLINSDTNRMKALHFSWFICLILEISLDKNKEVNFPYTIIACLILFQSIRFWSMKSLGQFWTIKNFKFNTVEIKQNGIYHWMLHPNYFVVLLEFIFLPLLLKCYWTLIFFLPIKFYFLKKRIAIEEETLLSFSDYQDLKKRVRIKILFF